MSENDVVEDNNQVIDLKGRSIVSTNDLNLDEIDYIFRLAANIKNKWENNNIPGRARLPLNRHVLACLFYEPSTRTSSSFIAAMQKLGGTTIPITQGVNYSSVSKGETLHDTVRTLAQYSDVIVLRHPEEGSAFRAAHALKQDDVPLINAGDGPGEHPTQALLDLFTIVEQIGEPSGKHIALVGDLLYGRTIHSLIRLLMRYNNVALDLVSPKSLQLPENLLNELKLKGADFRTTNNIRDVIKDADVVYATRTQQERLSLRKRATLTINQGNYRITPSLLTHAKDDMIVMHPMPRTGEIDRLIDGDKRAFYFQQVKNGMYVRMAILLATLGEEHNLLPADDWLKNRIARSERDNDRDNEV